MVKIRDSIKTGVKAAFSVSVFVVVVSSVGPARVWEIVTGADIHLFGLAVGLASFNLLLSAKKLQLLLAAKDEHVSYLNVVRYYYIGTFFNSFLPSTIGGDAVKAYRLFDDTKNKEEAAAAVFMDRYTGLVALICIAVLAALFAPVPLPNSIVVSIYATAGAVILITLLLLWRPVNQFLPNAVPGVIMAVMDVVSRVQTAVGEYRRRIQAVGMAFLLSVCFHTLLITINIILARALGMATPWQYFFVFIPIAAVILFLPISIGGLGVREAVYTFLFAMAGTAAAEAVSLSLLFQGIFLINVLIGGSIYGLEELQQ